MSSSPHHAPAGVPAVNLQRYASEAILPRMLYKERESHESTPRSPDGRRTLKSVHRIPKDDFFKRVTSYFNARPPSAPRRSPGSWSLRVPHTNHPTVSDAGVLPVVNEMGVQTWVELVALQTALCLLHSAEPELLDLEFSHVTGPGTRNAQSDFVFKMGSPDGYQPYQPNTLMVEVKCPWTLSFSDMEEISRTRDGLPLVTSTGKRTYDSTRSVLAQTYDYCTRQGHCFWIITTYDHWVFGVFSADYHTALATEPIRYDNVSPTVLQCIVYWLQSSTFRSGAFEIPKAMGFSGPSSRGLWVDTLKLWRKNAVQELGPKFAGGGYNNSDYLRTKCVAALNKRNWAVDSAATSFGDSLQDACREALRLLQTPSDNLEWTVLLTWLALLLNPITTTPELPCLEEAFRTASENHIHQPNLFHWEGRRGRDFKFPLPQGANSTIWRAGTHVKPVGSLEEFYRNHASQEVAFILERYLPPSIQDEIKDMLLKLRLLGSASPEPQTEGSGSDVSSQTEDERTSERQVMTDRARGKRPAEPRRSEASATQAFSSHVQNPFTSWRTRQDSEDVAGPSFTPKTAARPSLTAYRSDSSSMLSPATPMTRRAPNHRLFSPSSESTPYGDDDADSPASSAGKGEDVDKIGSLTDMLTARLGGLAIQSPRPDSSSARPTSTGRSPLSTNSNNDGLQNPFKVEPVQSLVVPPRPVNASPGRSSTYRSERSVESDAPSDGQIRVEIEGEGAGSNGEEIKIGILLEYLVEHPDDCVDSFDDLVQQNKLSEEALQCISTHSLAPFYVNELGFEYHGHSFFVLVLVVESHSLSPSYGASDWTVTVSTVIDRSVCMSGSQPNPAEKPRARFYFT